MFNLGFWNPSLISSAQSLNSELLTNIFNVPLNHNKQPLQQEWWIENKLLYWWPHLKEVWGDDRTESSLRTVQETIITLDLRVYGQKTSRKVSHIKTFILAVQILRHFNLCTYQYFKQPGTIALLQQHNDASTWNDFIA